MTNLGDTSRSARRSRRFLPLIVLVAIVVVVGAIFLMMRTPTGPGSNEGKVAGAMSDVRNPAASAGGSNGG